MPPAHARGAARRSADAKASYDAAIAATENSAERAYLSRKRGELV